MQKYIKNQNIYRYLRVLSNINKKLRSCNKAHLSLIQNERVFRIKYRATKFDKFFKNSFDENFNFANFKLFADR